MPHYRLDSVNYNRIEYEHTIFENQIIKDSQNTIDVATWATWTDHFLAWTIEIVRGFYARRITQQLSC